MKICLGLKAHSGWSALVAVGALDGEFRVVVQAAVGRSREWGHDIAACAVLVPQPLPNWSVDQILAVHVRMHQAEGVLFPDAIARAADACGLRLVAIPEKQLGERAERALGARLSHLVDEVAAMGKSVGPPWGKDQKSAALAAMVALRQCSK